MNFLKNLFSKKENPVNTYEDFWNWFGNNSNEFYNLVKSHYNIQHGFFDKLTPKLAQLKDGYSFLTGMYNDTTAELVITADGDPQNIVFVEELVAAAPQINGWKFVALKPALDIKNVSIDMGDFSFNENNLHFYDSGSADYPDEIEITIVHDDYSEENKIRIISGVYIFLDNYLGELEFVNNIDNLTITGKQNAVAELIPIAKLKEFLVWRQKEFVEKYEGVRYKTDEDSYSMLEAELPSGNPLLAVINNELLNWDCKASHPWIGICTMKYDGSNNNGLPNEQVYNLMNSIEEEILQDLKDYEGFLNIGRQTAEGERNVFFACKDFRKPSKVFFQIQQKYANRIEIEYAIFKDKYWRYFDRFIENI